MTDKSRWQKEFDVLPEWAKNLVRGLAGCGGYGGLAVDEQLGGYTQESREKYSGFHILLGSDAAEKWWDGFFEIKELAEAMTAPWPPPDSLPPHEKMTTANIVEMMTAGDDDCAFDQPCYFGHRVDCHAVYCRNEAWPDSPRKCRRNRTDYRHEDCPGFVANADYKP